MDYLDLKVGYTCNNNCIHCVIKGNEQGCRDRGVPVNRTRDECKEEILFAKNSGAKMLTFTGGEATIRKDIIELISYARSLGLDVALQTNGRSFYYPEFAKRISDLGISSFVIALHSDLEDVHDSITRKKGSFRQTVEGIRNLVNLGQAIHGKVVLSKMNYSRMKELVQFLHSLGVDRICIAFPHGEGNAWIYRDEVIPRYSDIMPYIYDMLTYVRLHDEIDLSLETFPFCMISQFPEYFMILPAESGKSAVKNVGNSQPIDWDVVRPMIKSKPVTCTSCRYDASCEGPWKDYVQMYGEGEFKPL